MRPAALLVLLLAALVCAADEPAPAPKLVGTFSGGHVSFLRAVVFSPDGKMLGSQAVDGVIKVYDVERRTVVATVEVKLPVNGHAVFCFSPDGKMLAAAGDEHVQTWEATTGKPLATLKFETNPLAVVFSPDSKQLVSSTPFGIQWWDPTKEGKPTKTWKTSVGAEELVFGPDGKKLVANGITTVEVWDVKKEKVVGTCDTESRGEYANARVSPDGKIVVTGVGEDVRLLDCANGKKVGQLTRPTRKPGEDTPRVTGVSFDKDGATVAVATQDTAVTIWDVKTRKPTATIKIRVEENNAPAPLAMSPDGKTVATISGATMSIQLWDVKTGESVGALRAYKDSPICLTFAADGQALAAVDSYGADLWEMPGRKLRRAVRPQYPAQYRSSALTADGKTLFLSGHNGAKIDVVETATAKLATALDNGKSAECMAVSHDGKLLAAGSSNGVIKLWDVSGRKEKPALEGPGGVKFLAFSNDSKVLVAAGHAGGVILFDVPGRKKLADFTVAQKGEKANVFGLVLALSPDGKTLLRAVSGGAIELWDPVAGKKTGSLTGHKGDVACLVFSPDGKTLASGAADGAAKLWDVATSKETVTLSGHHAPVSGLAFAPDGAALVTAAGGVTATGGYDFAGTLYLWELPAGPRR